MTANVNPELFNISDGLIVRNVKRNVVGSREQRISLNQPITQTTHIHPYAPGS